MLFSFPFRAGWWGKWWRTVIRFSPKAFVELTVKRPRHQFPTDTMDSGFALWFTEKAFLGWRNILAEGKDTWTANRSMFRSMTLRIRHSWQAVLLWLYCGTTILIPLFLVGAGGTNQIYCVGIDSHLKWVTSPGECEARLRDDPARDKCEQLWLWRTPVLHRRCTNERQFALCQKWRRKLFRLSGSTVDVHIIYYEKWWRLKFSPARMDSHWCPVIHLKGLIYQKEVIMTIR
jgi:hypothetical protein